MRRVRMVEAVIMLSTVACRAVGPMTDRISPSGFQGHPRSRACTPANALDTFADLERALRQATASAVVVLDVAIALPLAHAGQTQIES